MKTRAWFFLVLGLFVLTVLACDRKKDEKAVAEPIAKTVEKADQPVMAAVDRAENLGLKIGSSYVETLKQVVAILKDKPSPDDAMSMLGDMKNWTIDLMVGLGKERAALSEADRAVVDRVLSQKISSISPDLFKEYQDGQALYKEHADLFRLIADFNIITQYSDFELLRKQQPQEADRLGIQ